jgi:hypothetical protein
MFGLKDLMELLDRWDEWKAVRAGPGRIDALEKEIAELRERLGPSDKWPPDVCKACGARALRLGWTRADQTVKKIKQDWNCGECRAVEVRYA